MKSTIENITHIKNKQHGYQICGDSDTVTIHVGDEKISFNSGQNLHQAITALSNDLKSMKAFIPAKRRMAAARTKKKVVKKQPYSAKHINLVNRLVEEQGTVSISQFQKELAAIGSKAARSSASVYLSKMCANGLIKRVGRGLYG